MPPATGGKEMIYGKSLERYLMYFDLPLA